jgi:probable rRNA maturation factor
LAIRFFLHHARNKITGKKVIKACIGKILEDHNKKIGEINIIITSDSELLKINKKFLNRVNYTDIITFNNSEGAKISGELYISIERIKDNAVIYNIESDNELLRVIIHGVLHLLEYDDKNEKEKKQMRKLEDHYIEKYYKKGSVNI